MSTLQKRRIDKYTLKIKDKDLESDFNK